MSTHFSKKIPSSDEWIILDTHDFNSQTITPELSKKIFNAGYKYIYITLGVKYGEQQHKYQQSLDNKDFDILKGDTPVLFQAIIIDSLNCCHKNISDILPSKLYILGKKSFTISQTLYNSWDGIAVTPDQNKTHPAYNIYQTFSRFPEKMYDMYHWNNTNKLNILLGKSTELSPIEKKKICIENERRTSIFGDIIAIFQKYYKNNWVCITTKTKIDDKLFQKKYNRFASSYIMERPITYYFNNKVYFGGSIVKPIEPVKKHEFEYFFGFSNLCRDFNVNKTRYFYNTNIGITRKCHNSIYDYLNGLEDILWDREFYKFLFWVGVNHLGVMLDNEFKFSEELAKFLDLKPLTENEIYNLCYPNCLTYI